MYIELFKARKSLHDIMKIKSYIILDLEFAKINKQDQRNYIVNISAKHYKNNKIINEYNKWKMPSGTTKDAIESLVIKKHLLRDNVVSKNQKEYNDMFYDFYNWITKNRLTKTPVIGWGIDADLESMAKFFKEDVDASDSSTPMFEYDLQKIFAKHIDSNALSLQSALNLLGVKDNNQHIGIKDVELINEVKSRIKILMKTFNL